MNMEKERLEKASPDCVADFLTRRCCNLSEELIQRCLKVIIDRGDLESIGTILIYEKELLLKRLPGLRKELLERALTMIENTPFLTWRAQHFLYFHWKPFMEDFKKRLEKTLKRFLLSENPNDLLWLLIEFPCDNFKKLKLLAIKRLKERMEEIIEVITLKQVFSLIRDSDLLWKQKLKLLRKILNQKNLDEGHLILAYSILRDSKFPLDLQEKAMEVLHSQQTRYISRPVLKIIKKILRRRWVPMTEEFATSLSETGMIDWPRLRFQRVNEIPVFPDRRWRIIDIEEKISGNRKTITGALLRYGRLNQGEQVILLLDLDKFNGYAFRADPRAKTVEEAIAYGYQLDPGKFKGFAIEK